jgi:DNA-binding MarR family transcriptional regulator/GNAT superfamily N-acetyltransferase
MLDGDTMAPAVADEDVAAVRAFNRFYTRLIRVLDEAILDSAYSLTEARVLFELAAVPSVEVTALRAQLGLDAGYLSRIVARFEGDGLAERRRSPHDGRKVVLALTEAGREAFAEVDRSSAAEVGRLLAGVGPDRRRRALAAMRTIEAALGERPANGAAGAAGTAGPTVVLRPPEPGDMGWIVARHGATYAAEYGWDTTFEGYVAELVADLLVGEGAAHARTWLAEVDGERAGCIACARDDATTARLRILLVEPHARGLGLGGRLVDECLRFARRSGYRRITLQTYDLLADARRLYQRAGFTLDRSWPATAYGHTLTEQSWSRSL